jgi:hypothetical protein
LWHKHQGNRDSSYHIGSERADITQFTYPGEKREKLIFAATNQIFNTRHSTRSSGLIVINREADKYMLKYLKCPALVERV